MTEDRYFLPYPQQSPVIIEINTITIKNSNFGVADGNEELA